MPLADRPLSSNNPHVEVRRAVPEDAAAVRGVIERAIQGVSAAESYAAEAVEAWAGGGSQEGVRRMIETTDGFVATHDGLVVGWANLDEEEVDQLYVDPVVEGRGVARHLYEVVERLARAKDLMQLKAVASLRAEAAFCRFGFSELTRETRPFNGETFAIVRMTKLLDGPKQQ